MAKSSSGHFFSVCSRFLRRLTSLPSSLSRVFGPALVLALMPLVENPIICRAENGAVGPAAIPLRDVESGHQPQGSCFLEQIDEAFHYTRGSGGSCESSQRMARDLVVCCNGTDGWPVATYTPARECQHKQTSVLPRP